MTRPSFLHLRAHPHDRPRFCFCGPRVISYVFVHALVAGLADGKKTRHFFRKNICIRGNRRLYYRWFYNYQQYNSGNREKKGIAS